MCEANRDGLDLHEAHRRHCILVVTIEQAIRRNTKRRQILPGIILFDCGLLLPEACPLDARKLSWHTSYGSFGGRSDAIRIIREQMDRNPDPERLAAVVEAIRDAVYPTCAA